MIKELIKWFLTIFVFIGIFGSLVGGIYLLAVYTWQVLLGTALCFLVVMIWATLLKIKWDIVDKWFEPYVEHDIDGL